MNSNLKKSVSKTLKFMMKKMENVKKFNIYQALLHPN